MPAIMPRTGGSRTGFRVPRNKRPASAGAGAGLSSSVLGQLPPDSFSRSAASWASDASVPLLSSALAEPVLL